MLTSAGQDTVTKLLQYTERNQCFILHIIYNSQWDLGIVLIRVARVLLT